MQVTYIGHSGFLVETAEAYLLFDCTEPVPQLKPEKELLVFVSHRHGDHYSRAIWQLGRKYEQVSYFIAKDIPFSAKVRERLGITDSDLPHIQKIYGGQVYEWKLQSGTVMKIETLYSTDEGVAFYVELGKETIYHAGDLNLWVWAEESEGYNKDMTGRFKKAVEPLRGRSCDVAFLPLDPRQEADAYRGMDAYLQLMDVNYVFPMHFWKQYEIITDYIAHCKEKKYVSAIQKIQREGQTFVCE